MAGDDIIRPVTKEERARLKAEYIRLVAMPADQIRDLAARQRDLAKSGLKQIRDLTGELVDRWKPYDRVLEDVDKKIERGDSLKDKTDEESRKQRRRDYAAAYQDAYLVADAVDAEGKLGGTFRLTLEDTYDAAAEAAKAAGKYIGQAADKLGHDVESAGEVLVWATAAGMILWFIENARGRSRTRR